jgi:hypothetical protein
MDKQYKNQLIQLLKKIKNLNEHYDLTKYASGMDGLFGRKSICPNRRVENRTQ